MGIECRFDDLRIRELFVALNYYEIVLRVIVERVMNIRFEGGC